MSGVAPLGRREALRPITRSTTPTSVKQRLKVKEALAVMKNQVVLAEVIAEMCAIQAGADDLATVSLPMHKVLAVLSKLQSSGGAPQRRRTRQAPLHRRARHTAVATAAAAIPTRNRAQDPPNEPGAQPLYGLHLAYVGSFLKVAVVSKSS